jgi:CPA2 family monovalent cation:H+ antiporter-2
MESHILTYLQSIVILFGVSASIVFALGKVRIPSIVGFLVAGLVMGPSGLDIVKNAEEIQILAEIGVVLLMFTIGLEFSLRNLMALRKLVFGGGTLQVVTAISFIALLSHLYLHVSLNQAVFLGFLVSLSSTAIVLKMLLDRAEMHTSYGRSSIGMLIFQDLCVVPFMLFIPVLAGNGGSASTTAYTLVKALLIIGGVLISSRWLVPFVLHQVVSLKSRELFVITVILLCLGTALLLSNAGLSLALGAFLAGIIISESEYSSQAISDILPFKEAFTGLFFITIGMLLDLSFLFGSLATIGVVVLIIVLIKIVTSVIAAFLAGQTIASGLQTGFYLSQIGEFSFILAVVGMAQGLITQQLYQVFLAASIITMMITPFMMGAAVPVSEWLVSSSPFRRLSSLHAGRESGRYPETLDDHVIVIGFGVNGSNIARVLKEAGIPYAVLESDPSIVRRGKKQGEPIYYGDGASVELLHSVGLDTARLLVVVISDPSTTRRIIQTAKQHNPDILIIVRTRLVAEVDHLVDAGADEVVPEEFETSIEIFSKILHHYHMPANIIREQIDKVREKTYLAFRGIDAPRTFLFERLDLLKNVVVETYSVQEKSGVVGLTLGEIKFRSRTGTTIIGVERGKTLHQMPSSSFRLQPGDVLFFIGSREKVRSGVDLLDSVATGEEALQEHGGADRR